ncbi:hypothetical protein [Catellatospora sichuanensis]|uniref:hypothetical protein n=1 Tax=Catellatospora sichuanensis TaxID=1969805 RepID=UPI001181CA09|nr:hypothetical protein [Catellatospora sichuanensis]
MSRLAHPAVAAGLAVISTDDGLLIEGGPSRRLFTGAAAHDLMPRLLPLLDGRTSLAAVAQATSTPVTQVAQAVALLHRSGLLHDGVVDRDDAADAFLSRAVAAAGSPDQPATLRKRLAEAAVVVAAAGPLGDLLADDLAQSGIGTITADPTTTAALAVADDDRLASVAATGVPVLRIGGDDSHVELGPLFTGPDTSCPQCFLGGAGRGGAGPLGLAAAQLLSALTVAEVIAWLTRLSAPATGRRLHRIDTVTLDRSIHEVTPSADCPTCTLADDGPIGRLEWLNRRPSWQVPADRTVPAPADIDLASAPRTPLSEAPSWLRPLLSAATARPYADTYLLAVDGLPHPVHRWSPTAQALVAARGDLTTCPPISGLPETPAAVLVFVAATARLTAAYAEQSLRRAFLAAGRAVAAVTAATADHDAVLADTVDQALADLLELRDGGEQPAAVVGIYPRRP